MAYRYFKTFEIVTQDKVNYARNCIGAIGSCRTFLQNLHTLKCGHRNRGRINKYGSVVRYSASDRLTLTVHEHQGRCKAQTTQVHIGRTLRCTCSKGVWIILRTATYR